MRDVKFEFKYDGIGDEWPGKITVPGAWSCLLSEQEAREIFFQIGGQLGYTYTHCTEKKPTPTEPIPQPRQDIAATATLHGMGYTWHGGEQWKPPLGEKPDFNLVDSLRTRITVLTQQAEVQDQTLQGWREANQKMVAALAALRGALGLPKGPACGGRVEDGVLEAVQELQRQLEERKQLAEVQQRANTEATSLILRIHTALGVEEPFDAEGTGIIPAIASIKGSLTGWEMAAEKLRNRADAAQQDNAAAFAALKDHGYTPARGETLGTLIRDAFGAESLKLSALIRDRDAKWAMGRIAGVQQERKRCWQLVDLAIADNKPRIMAADADFYQKQGAQGALFSLRKKIADPA